MKQTKISYWLKGLVIVLMLGGALFWGWLIIGGVYLGPILGEVTLQDRSVILSFVQHIYAGFFYFAILVQFWKVCTEIGKDNSFSLENVRSFHLMAIFAGAEVAGFAVRFVSYIVFKRAGFLVIGFTGLEIFAAIAFLILCECLSQLISNAYEMKRENELTI